MKINRSEMIKILTGIWQKYFPNDFNTDFVKSRLKAIHVAPDVAMYHYGYSVLEMERIGVPQDDIRKCLCWLKLVEMASIKKFIRKLKKDKLPDSEIVILIHSKYISELITAQGRDKTGTCGLKSGRPLGKSKSKSPATAPASPATAPASPATAPASPATAPASPATAPASPATAPAGVPPPLSVAVASGFVVGVETEPPQGDTVENYESKVEEVKTEGTHTLLPSISGEDFYSQEAIDAVKERINGLNKKHYFIEKQPKLEKSITGDAMSYMEKLYQAKTPVMLWGEAGAGKSTIVRNFCSLQTLPPMFGGGQVPYLSLSLDADFSVKNLFGGWALRESVDPATGKPSGATETYWREGILVQFIQIPSIILLDEITAINPEKNFLFHQLLADRYVYMPDARLPGQIQPGVKYNLHPLCWLVFAGNPPTAGYIGANKLNMAMMSRLASFEMEAPTKEKIMLVMSQYIADKNDMARFLRIYEDFRSAIKEKELETVFGMRESIRIGQLMHIAKMPMRSAVLLGYVNGTKMTSVDTYTALVENLDSILPA